MTTMAGKTDQTDWARLHAMTDEEAETNALADPDNPPLSAEQLASASRMPRIKIIRRALKLTQEEFFCPLSHSARNFARLGTEPQRAESTGPRLSECHGRRSRRYAGCAP